VPDPSFDLDNVVFEDLNGQGSNHNSATDNLFYKSPIIAMEVLIVIHKHGLQALDLVRELIIAQGRIL